MPTYELTRAAAPDLEELFEASLERFGHTRTERYVDELKSFLDLLGENPGLGTSAEDTRAGYRRFPHQSHIVFYRTMPNGGVLIVRVLHERMDAG